MPNISIIIPVYNAETTLDRCLQSICLQSYVDFEVLLIDDGATDKSSKIYNSYLAKDKRFKLFKQQNSGPSSARNKGLEQASGVYISFIDADDYVAKNYLEELLKAIKNSRATLSCSAYYELNNFIKNPVNVQDFPIQQVIDKNTYINSLFKGTAGVLWNKLYKKNIIIENNIRFDNDVKMSEDLIFNLAYALYCDTVAIVAIPLYYYNRQNDVGLSKNQNFSYLKDLAITNRAIKTIITNNKINGIDIKFITISRLYLLVKTLLYNAVDKDIKFAKSQFIEIRKSNQVNDNLLEFDENYWLDYLTLYFFKAKKYNLLYLYIKMIKFLRKIKRL